MDINLSTEDVDSFDLNFTRLNHSGGVITYAGKNHIETTFIDADNSNGGNGSLAFGQGSLGAIFLLQDWDTTLTNGDYNSDAAINQKFNDMYIRFVPKVNHSNWAEFVDFFSEDNDFAILANRELLNVLVQREKSEDEYKHAYSFKKLPADDEYALISADAIGLSIEDKETPFFRFGVPITNKSEGTPDPSTGPRVKKFKDSEVIVSCVVKSEFRNLTSSKQGDINNWGDLGEDETLIENLALSGGFLPFQITEKNRYKWKHIRGGMKDGVYLDEAQTPNKNIDTEDVESDEIKMRDYTDDQYDRLKRQETTGNITFIGTDTGYKIGDRIDNLIIKSNSIPVDSIILDLSIQLQSGTTIISIGKS